MNEEPDQFLDEFLERRLRGEARSVADVLAGHPELDAAQRDKLQRLAAALQVCAEEPEQAAPAPPERIGSYRILREIGHGGQGVVYLAEDERLARRVALKVLTHPALRLAGMTPTSDPAARLKREAETASRLNHPGICVVYEMGRQGDLAWIAMRHVEGETLAQRLARVRDAAAPDRREVLAIAALIERAARALHAAHEIGIVHRDIKPGNIMVTPAGEPVILDFGLAQDTDSDAAGLSLTGEMTGTPAYMSPEQLMPSLGRVDRRSDVYSLGVTFYECLTLRRPFEAPTRDRLHQLIRDGVVPDPRRANAAISKDLKIILQTALERDRDRRYRTALDFAEDLRRLREREPILARPAGPLLRFGRFVQRNPVLATATLGLIVTLATGLGLSLHLLRRAEGERLVAEARAELLRDPGLALLLAIEGAERAPSLIANNTLVAALDQLREVRTAGGHAPVVVDADISPDGRWLATASTDHAVVVRDTATGDVAARLDGHSASVHCVSFSEDGRRLISASDDGCVRVWDAETWRSVQELSGRTSTLTGAVFDVSGKRVATGGNGREARVWNADTGAVLATVDAGGAVSRVDGVTARFSADGSRLVTIAFPSLLRIWDLASGVPVCVNERGIAWPPEAGVRGMSKLGATGPTVCLDDESSEPCLLDMQTGKIRARYRSRKGAFPTVFTSATSPDGMRVVLGGIEGGVYLGDADGKTVLERIGKHVGAVALLRFSDDGRRLLTDSGDGASRIWNATDGELVCSLAHQAGRIVEAQFLGDGDALVAACSDGKLRWWDLRDRMMPVCEGGVVSVDADPAGRRIACVASNGMVSILDTASGLAGAALAGVTEITPERFTMVRRATFSPDGCELLVAARDRRTHIVDVATGVVRLELAEPAGSRVWDAQYRPDGKRLVTAAEDGIARIWDVNIGELLLELPGHGAGIRSIAWSGDGRRIATSSEHQADGTVRVWDAETGESIRVLAPTGTSPSIVRLDLRGSRVAAACHDGVTRIWDVDARDSAPLRLEGHTADILGLDMTATGDFVVTSSPDRTVRLWNARTGTELVTVTTDQDWAWPAVAFTRDGKRIVCGGGDGRVRILPVNPLQEARARKPRELTAAERQRYGLEGVGGG